MPEKSRKYTDYRRGKWPDIADEARMEAMATAARIKELVHRAEELILAGQTQEALRLLSAVWDKANALETMMRLVKNGKWRD